MGSALQEAMQRKTPAYAGVFRFQQKRPYGAFWITAHARRAPALPVGWVL